MKSLKLAKRFIQSQGGYTGDPITVIQKQQADIAVLTARLAEAERLLAALLRVAEADIEGEKYVPSRIVEAREYFAASPVAGDGKTNQP